MSKILELYLLLVCFMCFLIFACVLFIVGGDLVLAIRPELSERYHAEFYSCNLNYYNKVLVPENAENKTAIKPFNEYTAEYFKQQRLFAEQQILEYIKKSAYSSIITKMMPTLFIIICFIIHLFYYIRFKSLHTKNDTN